MFGTIWQHEQNINLSPQQKRIWKVVWSMI